MKASKAIFVYTLIFLNLSDAFASGDTHGGIPWELITAQVFNFSLFFAVLVFLLKKPIAGFFAKYREDFLEESSKAQKVVAAAEKQKKEIEDQLKKLETTYSSRLESSKKEAQNLRNTIIEESKLRSSKLISDTNESAAVLFKSAEQGIKSQVLGLAMTEAKSQFTKKIDSKESDRLQSEFLEEISAGSL
jgi:F0F1-type ATP synthase membrane subunit b/b'